MELLASPIGSVMVTGTYLLVAAAIIFAGIWGMGRLAKFFAPPLPQ